jgi:succinate dehydrogenase/fumarate reductase flavoprotein subunit
MGPLAGKRTVKEVAGFNRATAFSQETVVEVTKAVREEMLPLDKNFFRQESRLASTATHLDDVWDTAQSAARDPSVDLLRSHEATALLATARWSVASARARKESRGIHRLQGHPASLPELARRIETGGLDRAYAAYERKPVEARL